MAAAIIEHVELECLLGETERAVHMLLNKAFKSGDAYYALDRPDDIILLTDDGAPIGHLAAYMRTVGLGEESIEVGVIGGVTVDERYRRLGLAKRLVQEAHRVFTAHALPFSILFAFDPERYVSSGYRDMTNRTRFLDATGDWKQAILRGGMFAELAQRKWPGTLLDLRGRAL